MRSTAGSSCIQARPGMKIKPCRARCCFGRSFAQISAQLQVLLTCGKTSKLICPPIEYVRLRSANFSFRISTNLGLQQHSAHSTPAHLALTQHLGRQHYTYKRMRSHVCSSDVGQISRDRVLSPLMCTDCSAPLAVPPAASTAGNNTTLPRKHGQHSLLLHQHSLPPTYLTLACLSYRSNSSRSSWLQLRPMGDTFIMPLRNSIKVPRLMGMSRSAT